MKKNFLMALLIIMISIFPLSVQAQEISALFISCGITDEGVTYQVYGEIISTTANSVTVTRSIVYDGNVTANTSLSWTENIDGSFYSGTLRLIRSSYNESTNQTTATYYGTLYKK